VARKTNAQRLNEKKISTGISTILFIFLMILAVLRLGFLGIFLANLLRFFVGSTFQILASILCFAVIRRFFKIRKMKTKGAAKKYAHSKSKINLLGVLPFYLGILLFLQTGMFSSVTNPHVLRTTLALWWQDFAHFKMVNFLGGGFVGGILYSLSNFLVANSGSYFIAVFAIIVGAFLLLPINLSTLDKLGQIVHKLVARMLEKNESTKKKNSNQNFSSREKKKTLREKIINLLRSPAVEKNLTEEEKDESSEKNTSESLLMPVITNFQDVQGKDANDEFKDQCAFENLGEDDEKPIKIEIQEEPENLAYKLPTSSLFTKVSKVDQKLEQQQAKNNVVKLEEAFASFGINIKVIKVSIGPSVTKYEIKPPVGVKISRITSLSDDIALALAAKDVRIEAPIPGKSVIGIEIPNKQIMTVAFRDIIENAPKRSDGFLEVPLGRDISGQIQVMDLEKMPHLLIAGSTGAGKSVAVNGIISSILMKAKPNEAKLVMIDPKMVELSVYNGIPHLLTPVVVNPRKAAKALNKVVEEMERRYELFAKFNVRKIFSYNTMVQKENLENGANQPTMPLIIVIVDELADLMMVASNDVEDAIIRLGQKARAAGIHMVLATQRPSVDVISGLIKANVPSRISFAVSSGIDSRTVLDSNGAEKLLGRGDMLYKPIDANNPIRIQGAFISDEEVERLVDFVKSQQKVQYSEKFEPSEVVDLNFSEKTDPNGHDEYFEEAKNLVIEEQTASTSLIQRRFKTGYNRALRIVEELEKEGIVGPSLGTKPREVLIKSLGGIETQEVL